MTSVPLNLPEQVDGLPTSPDDRGDEVQDRFRYQWAIGVVLLAEGITREKEFSALWCEHHEDFLIELGSGLYRAIQVKTDSTENAKWTVSASAFVKSVKRFCALESSHGAKIDCYEFCSNAPIYIPGQRVTKSESLASSPERLRVACVNAVSYDDLVSPYKEAFDRLAKSAEAEDRLLFAVFQKLRFRLGPPLRGYQDTLIARVIPALPNCSGLASRQLLKIAEELIRLVEAASGLPTGGVDAMLST